MFALGVSLFAYLRETDQETLTWSRRTGWWIQQGKRRLQTPGHIGWVETHGEEQKLGHLLLPQPPHHWSPASETERKRGGRERGRYLLSTYCKVRFTGQNDKDGVWVGGGAMTTDWKRKPTLCKAASPQKHEGVSSSPHKISPSTNIITQKQRSFFIQQYTALLACVQLVADI